ncbi:hypothetical protein IQ250_20865 [Pseudanabaenaceae cyanobacterium LEGE 13415]|nr:hypothetical protein [Pseudanabaenaceae cyanobacterium LEGE 13415]
MNEVNPENVCTVYYAVFALLQGLNDLQSHPINLKEQALALEQLALNLSSSANRIAAFNAIVS